MLFQNNKSIMMTLTFLVIGGGSISGTASAQGYRYPPANAAVQPQQQTAPVTRPVMMTQPGRVAQAPYSVQRPPQQRGFNPRSPAYGIPPYTANPYAANRNAAMPYGPPLNRPATYRPAPYGPPLNRPVPSRPTAYGPPQNRPAPYRSAPVAGARPMGAGPGMPPPRYGNTDKYNRGPYNSRPYKKNNNPFGGGPFDKMGFGPFTGDSAPWESWPFGSHDSFWSRKEFPFDEQNPSDWFDPEDPKEGLAIMWDDLISAPDDLGTMPGGWYVPSVSVPNPVDLEDQMEKASKEVPDLIRIYN